MTQRAAIPALAVEVWRLQVELEQAAARAEEVKQAVDWLWGFWDGNTLIAAPSCDIVALHEAWYKLLALSHGGGVI